MYLRKLILLHKSKKGAYLFKYFIKIKKFFAIYSTLSHLNNSISQKGQRSQFSQSNQ